jgi:hypothetical protein
MVRSASALTVTDNYCLGDRSTLLADIDRETAWLAATPEVRRDEHGSELDSIITRIGEDTMTNYVILGVKGDPTVYLVDLAHRTVDVVDPDMLDLAGRGSAAITGIDFALGAGRSDAASLQYSPASKAEAVRGIDFAVAASERTDAASLQYSPASKAEAVRGIDFAMAASERTDAASLQYSPASKAEAVRGIDFAMVASERTDAASLQYSPASKAEAVRGIDFAIAASERTDAASLQYSPAN